MRSGVNLDDLWHSPTGLTVEKARALLMQVLSGALPDVAIGATLAALQQRPLRLAERVGFLHAMRESGTQLGPWMPELVHVCGAAGGKRRTFLASPAAAFIAASAGVPVAFHGPGIDSPGVTERAVLMALGVPETTLANSNVLLQGVGVATVAMADTHPQLERLLRLPLPAACTGFLHDLWRLTLPPGAATVLGHTEREQCVAWAEACMIAMRDGLQLSRLLQVQEWEGGSDPAPVWPVAGVLVAGKERRGLYQALHAVGIEAVPVAKLPALSVTETAEMTRRVLQGRARSQPHVDAILLSAALILYAAYPHLSLAQALSTAREQVASGAAWMQLERMQSWATTLTPGEVRPKQGQVINLRKGAGA